MEALLSPPRIGIGAEGLTFATAAPNELAHDDAGLARKVEGDIAGRAVPGQVAYLALSALVLAAASHAWQVSAIFGAGNVLLVAIRHALIRGRKAAWLRSFALATVGIGLLWGMFGSYIILNHALDTQTLVVLLCLAGICAGATPALAPLRELQRAFAIAVLGPLALAAIERIRNLSDATLPTMIICYLGYLLLQGRRAHEEYRSATVTGRRLEVLNQHLMLMSQLKGAFIADLSHELRTPMTAIKGYADLLLDGEMREPERQWIVTIGRSSDTLLAIINDLIDVSQLESGKLRIETGTVRLRELFDELEILLRERVETKGIAWTLVLSQDLPSEIRADVARLRQLTTHLVAQLLAQSTGGQLELAVGIVENALEVRVTTASAKPAEGIALPTSLSRNSLSWAICTRLSEALGGSLSLDASAAGSVRAIFRLPLRANAETKLGAALPSVRRVLVAEHDDDHAELLRVQLQRAGIAVTRLAMQAAPDNLASQVVLDPALPDAVVIDASDVSGDGLALARSLRDQHYAGRIVATSASGLPDEIDRCRAAGCDAFVAKPFEQQTLLEGVLGR